MTVTVISRSDRNDLGGFFFSLEDTEGQKLFWVSGDQKFYGKNFYFLHSSESRYKNYY